MEFPSFRKLFCVLTLVVITIKEISSMSVDIFDNPCTKGPAYWCTDPSNSRKCGIKSSLCAKYNEHLCKTQNISYKLPEPIGSNPCTWGPSYWCASVENAEKCGLTKAECDKSYGGIKSDTTTTATTHPIIGGNPCTWGPSYWCASVDNAKKCGLKESDCEKYGGIPGTAAVSSP